MNKTRNNYMSHPIFLIPITATVLFMLYLMFKTDNTPKD